MDKYIVKTPWACYGCGRPAKACIGELRCGWGKEFDKVHELALVHDELFDARYQASWYLAQRDEWIKKYAQMITSDAQQVYEIRILRVRLEEAQASHETFCKAAADRATDAEERAAALSAQVSRQYDQIQRMDQELREQRTVLFRLRREAEELKAPRRES